PTLVSARSPRARKCLTGGGVRASLSGFLEETAWSGGVHGAGRRGQGGMRKTKLEHYRKLLQTKQSEISRNFAKSKAESRSAGDDGTEDYIDYAVNSYAKEFLLSLTDMERQQIVLIQEALVRIRSGEYGHCQQCGEEIV